MQEYPTVGRLGRSGLASAWFLQPLCLWLGHVDFGTVSHSESSFQSGQFNEDMIPTVGFNMRKITKGNVTIKVRARKLGGAEDSVCVCWGGQWRPLGGASSSGAEARVPLLRSWEKMVEDF